MPASLWIVLMSDDPYFEIDSMGLFSKNLSLFRGSVVREATPVIPFVE